MSASSRHKTEDAGPALDPNGWMLSFSDTLTNLLCFFVLLLTMSSMDARKLKETFGFFDAAAGALDYNSQNASEIGPSEVQPVVSNALASDVAKALRLHLAGSEDPLTAAQEVLRPYSALGDLMVVVQRADGLHVDIAHAALFDEQDRLTADGRALLNAMATLTQSSGLRLLATVWCARAESFVPVLKTKPDSWERAATLGQLVLQVLGSPRERLATLRLGLRGDGVDTGPGADGHANKLEIVLQQPRGD
ncbi:MAG: flagellar motor protein MotB [Pseudomonadota bacterium]